MSATSTDRKVTAMCEWAETLTRSARLSLDRMNSTLIRTEEKIARVRDKIARRDRELKLTQNFH